MRRFPRAKENPGTPEVPGFYPDLFSGLFNVARNPVNKAPQRRNTSFGTAGQQNRINQLPVIRLASHRQIPFAARAPQERRPGCHRSRI